MPNKRRVTLCLEDWQAKQVETIAALEQRQPADVARLLLRLGTLQYMRQRSLLCDYGTLCTRKNCCNGGRPERQRLEVSGLYLIEGKKEDAG